MALIGEHLKAAWPPQDDDQKESLQRVCELLARGCERHHTVPLTAQMDKHYVRVFSDSLDTQQVAFALGALQGAGIEYNEKLLSSYPRQNKDGSLSFQSMNDAMLCAYAFGTPMAERQHSAAVRKETPATGPRTRS